MSQTDVQWEYRSFNGALTDEKLNELGQQGWELCTHTVVVQYANINQRYIFKRLRSASS